jgi:hypothetical protein
MPRQSRPYSRKASSPRSCRSRDSRSSGPTVSPGVSLFAVTSMTSSRPRQGCRDPRRGCLWQRYDRLAAIGLLPRQSALLAGSFTSSGVRIGILRTTPWSRRVALPGLRLLRRLCDRRCCRFGGPRARSRSLRAPPAATVLCRGRPVEAVAHHGESDELVIREWLSPLASGPARVIPGRLDAAIAADRRGGAPFSRRLRAVSDRPGSAGILLLTTHLKAALAPGPLSA